MYTRRTNFRRNSAFGEFDADAAKLFNELSVQPISVHESLRQCIFCPLVYSMDVKLSETFPILYSQL